jgi:hypothetical protein
VKATGGHFPSTLPHRRDGSGRKKKAHQGAGPCRQRRTPAPRDQKARHGPRRCRAVCPPHGKALAAPARADVIKARRKRRAVTPGLATAGRLPICRANRAQQPDVLLFRRWLGGTKRRARTVPTKRPCNRLQHQKCVTERFCVKCRFLEKCDNRLCLRAFRACLRCRHERPIWISKPPHSATLPPLQPANSNSLARKQAFFRWKNAQACKCSKRLYIHRAKH